VPLLACRALEKHVSLTGSRGVLESLAFVQYNYLQYSIQYLYSLIMATNYSDDGDSEFACEEWAARHQIGSGTIAALLDNGFETAQDLRALNIERINQYFGEMRLSQGLALADAAKSRPQTNQTQANLVDQTSSAHHVSARTSKMAAAISLCSNDAKIALPMETSFR
jgi:hypothetical protein